MVKSLRGLLMIGLPASILILVFQNCGDIGIQALEMLPDASNNPQTLNLSICSDRREGQSPLVLQNVYIANLTAKPVDGFLVPDSDLDGLSDAAETELGSNPIRPRSRGTILDSLCGDDGTSCSPTACTNSPAGFLLTDCDLRASATGGALNGKDSDRDGLPDYFEILRELKPAEAAIAASDTDTDGQPYLLEAMNGSDPGFRESAPQSLWVSTSEIAADTGIPCPMNQERRTYQISRLQFTSTSAFQDLNSRTGLTWSRQTSGGPLDLSHAAGENVFVVFYTAKSAQGAGVYKTFYYIFKLSESNRDFALDIDDTDFTEMN